MLNSITLLIILFLHNILENERQENELDTSKTGLKCVEIRSCPYVLDLLQIKTITDEIKNLAISLRCDTGSKSRKVWCTDSSSSADIPLDAVFDFQLCGIGKTPRRYIRIIGGGVNAIDSEFPWMAILEYRNRKNELRRQCGGTLINPKYVLTAAHCLLIHDTVGKLESVTLGEFDTQKQSEVEGRYLVDIYIVHPLYEDTAKIGLHHHDIGMVKLRENVEYTESIVPICLPNSDIEEQQKLNNVKYIAAGWGITQEGYVSTSILQKLEVPLYDSTNCTEVLGYDILSTQMCAGGEPGKDSCKGDSGGPLMAKDSTNRVYQVGIISLSIGRGCGVGRPNIYTDLTKYIGWIYENIQMD